LELNGRRLVVMEAMDKNNANAQVAKVDDKKKQDKRNLAQKREGLLNFEDWVHKQPRLTEKVIASRQRLLDEKEKALTNSTNLFVSKKRIQIRGLPRKDFFEGELKELMMVVIEEWLKTKTPSADSSVTTKSQKKKFLKQVKILRDENKVDSDSNKLPSGLGFAEFDDEALALFAIRYLNNMELVPNKGLIADYSLEDARVIHKREQRFERVK
jgi:RNA recognition motif-containing protein